MYRFKDRLSRFLEILLTGVAIFLILFGFTKASTYGWFDGKEPFRISGDIVDLDGYSIVPIVFELGILAFELSAILFLSRKQRLKQHPVVSAQLFPEFKISPLPLLLPKETNHLESAMHTLPEPASVITPPSSELIPPIAEEVEETEKIPTPARRVVIKLQDVSKLYGEGANATAALEHINLSILAGERVAIIGKSGSGKSTIMHILATLDQPTHGDIVIDDVPLRELSQPELDHLRNKKFGFVFQQFFLNARSTCLENVTLPLTIMGIPREERESRGLAILAAVGMREKAGQRAGELSGGQKQRICIARALITNPEVIFADEPTGNLDTENGARVIELLFKLQREKNITLVIVTHDPDLARLCDRTITIRDGHIVNQ